MTDTSRTWNLHNGHGSGDGQPGEKLYSRITIWVEEWIEQSVCDAIDGIITLDIAYKICERLHWFGPTRGTLERWYRCVLDRSADHYGALADCIEECNDAGFCQLTNKWLCIFNDYLRDREGYHEIAGIIQHHINEKRGFR